MSFVFVIRIGRGGIGSVFGIRGWFWLAGIILGLWFLLGVALADPETDAADTAGAVDATVTDTTNDLIADDAEPMVNFNHVDNANQVNHVDEDEEHEDYDVEIGGFVDVYYSFNFNRPSSRTNQLQNFAFEDNSFSLNLAELYLERPLSPTKNIGFRLDLGFGPTADWVHSADPIGSSKVENIQQAYLQWAPTGNPDDYQVDVGKFVTHMGAEVIESADNWNYSRGLLFSWAIPYYHTGIRASKYWDDGRWGSLSLTNGWNSTRDNNSGKTFGLQLGWQLSDEDELVVNYVAGPEKDDSSSDWRHVLGGIYTSEINPRLTGMVNANYGLEHGALGFGDDAHWWGAAGYLRYLCGAGTFFTLRAEYYNDDDGFTVGPNSSNSEVVPIFGDPSIYREITLTYEKEMAGYTGRLELRHDRSSIPSFMDDGGFSRSQTVFYAGLIAPFEIW